MAWGVEDTRDVDTIVVTVVVGGARAAALTGKAHEWKVQAAEGSLMGPTEALLELREDWLAAGCLDDDPIPRSLAEERIQLPIRRLVEALPSAWAPPTAGYRQSTRRGAVIGMAGVRVGVVPNAGPHPDATQLTWLLDHLRDWEWIHAEVVVHGPLELDALEPLDQFPVPLRRL
ncbi:MAG: hypothetical protein JJ863_06490 [Deltaproteobacteria bacterium]|nr:hypothetical protein [Deltaproteobacteria bacterium]